MARGSLVSSTTSSACTTTITFTTTEAIGAVGSGGTASHANTQPMALLLQKK